MVQSNGPAVTEKNKSLIDKLLGLAFEHWSLSCTRMPSRSHPGVSRPRASAAVETDVLYVLSAADRQGTGSALASSVGRANSSDDEDGEELEHDEDAADAAEEARVSAENLSKVPPFVPASGLIIIMPPDSQAALDSYSCTGKRLAMKFEGGWSICACQRGPPCPSHTLLVGLPRSLLLR